MNLPWPEIETTTLRTCSIFRYEAKFCKKIIYFVINFWNRKSRKWFCYFNITRAVHFVAHTGDIPKMGKNCDTKTIKYT